MPCERKRLKILNRINIIPRNSRYTRKATRDVLITWVSTVKLDCRPKRYLITYTSVSLLANFQYVLLPESMKQNRQRLIFLLT